MPAGTWNLPKIQKTVPYRGIKDISTIEIFDTTPTSDRYFNVLDFPDRLTAGKNLFRLNAANNTLVDNSEIHIEILDYNNNPIYFEPLIYLEQDGTRVISVYVYPDTSPGLATVYIAGRARVNVFEGNRPLPYVDNLRDTRTDGRMVTNKNELFKDYPNLLWQRTINVAPQRFNETEIIFTDNPKVTVVERVVNYQQPVTLNNVNVATSASNATIAISPVPFQGGLIANASSLNTAYRAAQQHPAIEGGTNDRTPLRSAGAPVSTVGLFSGNSSNTVVTNNNASVIAAANQTIQAPADVPSEQTSQGVTLNTGYSRATFTNFPLSASMEGGMIVIQNPEITVDLGTALVGSPSQVISAADIPVSTGGSRGDIFGGFVPDAMSTATTLPMSGSVVFVINDVESTTQAKVSQLAGPGHNAPMLTAFNFVALKSENNTQNTDQSIGSPTAYDIKTIEASANFTSSHTEPLVLSTTAQSQSFAEVVLSNIEPATGDVYKIRTSYKAAGQFGDFISAGDTILERVQLLEDTGSFEGTMAVGQIYNKIGYFTSLDDVNEYWQVDSSDEFLTTSIIFNNDIAINSAYPFSGQTFNTTDKKAIVFQIKDDYMPTVVKNARYAVRLRAINTVDILGGYNVTYGTGNNTSTITKPRFDVYISGSAGQGTILPIDSTYNAYRMTDYDIEPTLTGKLADDGYLGKLIGTVEMEPSVPGSLIGSSGVLDPSIVDVMFSFESTEVQNIKLSLVPRGSQFAFKGIGITTDSETGFSPNFTRMNIRIPSEFIDVPMIFKFEYFDYLGRKSDTETTVSPIKFTGDNTVINGDNNLLSGSVFVGNTIGSGIELAGVRSGFIRAVGYEGFLSASRTDHPGGFLMYTGSVLTDSPDDYTGVGLELVKDSGSFLRFATDDDVSGKPSGLDVRTSRFFFGSDSQFISGADGNIEISSSNFHLDNSGDVIMQGTITAEAGGTIGGFTIGADNLSATNFVLNTTDKKISLGSGNTIVTIDADLGLFAGNATHTSAPLFITREGQVTASSVLLGDKAGGNFLEFVGSTLTVQGSITADSISTPSAAPTPSSSISADGLATFRSASIAGFVVNTEEIKSSDNNLRLKSDGQITGSEVLFTGGKIGGWNLDTTKLFNTGVHLSASYGLRVFEDANNEVNIRYQASDDFGILGKSGGNVIFSLGANQIGGVANNQIAGWEFDNEKLQGGAMIIRKDGTIESDGFVSNLAGSGFRLTANQGGFLEVENARIRGTLATAVFEKETVNAVGGQLYIANSTVLTGSGQLGADVAPAKVHRATDTTMSVENVSGFTAGEIISAKKVSQTGFATEYIYIESASRNDAGSETDLTGKLFVIRGYSGSAPGDTGSLGDLASNPQSYSGSQVIVSTGKVGTGYVRINANPNDPTTPYIDIVERTGSAIYDISLKARLGDLSGITDSSFSDDVTGFGLYTENGYFKGKIEVASLPKPPASDDLIVHYPLQGSFLGDTGIARTADLSGNGHDSRNHANGLVDVTFISGSNSGPTGGALAFDGNSTVVENRTIQNSLTNGMDLTIAYWAKKEGFIAQRCHWHFTDGGNNEIALFHENNSTSGRFNLLTNDGSEGVIDIDTGSLALKGVWRHYAITIPHNTTNAALYIDGVKRGTFTGTIDLNSVEDIEQLVVGADVDSTLDNRNDYFTGSIADFRVYKKALTTSEIESLYSMPTAGTGRTIIEGNRITTGQIRSENWGASAGSEFDLNEGTFKLGGDDNPKLSFDASGNLTVNGTITVANTGDFVQPAETGSMLAEATGGLLPTSATGSMLAEATGGLVANAATSSLVNPSTYSFGGAGFTLGTHTTSTGLNMTSKFLGYFDGTTPKTFMSASGDFFLGGEGGAFIWDESEGSLLVSGSLVSFNTPTFFLGGEDQFISGSDGNIEIKSDNFELSTAGAISASAGNIAGFRIDSDKIQKNNNNESYVTIGAAETSNTGHFSNGRGFSVYLTNASASVGATKVMRMGQIGTKDDVYYPSTPEYGFQIVKRVGSTSYKDIVRFSSTEQIIGGFTVDEKSFSTTGVEINDSTQDLFISSSNFNVNHSGVLTASNALFTGEVVATNITETFVSVNDNNDHLYLRSVTGGKNLVFDGSLGGDIITNMEISTSAGFEIKDVELPFTGSDRVTAEVFIVTTGMSFDDGTVAGGYSLSAANSMTK